MFDHICNFCDLSSKTESVCCDSDAVQVYYKLVLS